MSKDTPLKLKLEEIIGKLNSVNLGDSQILSVKLCSESAKPIATRGHTLYNGSFSGFTLIHKSIKKTTFVYSDDEIGQYWCEPDENIDEYGIAARLGESKFEILCSFIDDGTENGVELTNKNDSMIFSGFITGEAKDIFIVKIVDL